MVGDDFFATLPAIHGFERIADPGIYQPLPNDWEIGVADVVSSTEAIEQGRYKAVNTAGAAVVSAVSNALGTLDFPYVFMGDGMCYAVGAGQAAVARQALAASVAWVGAELGLTLRGGVVSMAAIRASGRDVRVARFAPSAKAVYAMFSGGGLAWADAELKANHLPTPITAAGAQPDLTGLSCRFRAVPSRRGVILSLIVTPRANRHDPAFGTLVNEIVATIAQSDDAARPITEGSLDLPWPPKGFVQEARLGRRKGELLVMRMARVALRTLLNALIMRAGRDLGSFSPKRYKAELVENSDFRKYEDGLMMTLDCTAALAERLERRLREARAGGVADFGLHRQDAALITCVVPSPMRPDHVHFIDGAAGGYALAARALKRSRAEAAGTPSARLEPVTSSLQ